MKEPERLKMIGSTAKVSAALAGSDQNARIVSGRGLANLDVNRVVMKNDLTRNGDAAKV